MVSLSPLRHGNSTPRPYDALSMTALIGLMTLTFDLLTSKQVHRLPVRTSMGFHHSNSGLS